MSIFDRFRGSRDLEEEVVRLRREIRGLERAARRGGSASSLLSVARTLRDARSIEAFADAALGAILEVAGGTSAALVLQDEATGDLRAIAARGVDGTIPPATFVVSQGIAAEAARGGKPVATGSAAEDTRFRLFQSVQVHAIGSVLCLPLAPRLTPPGCLYLTGSGDRALRRADPEELIALADLVAIALDRLAMDAEISRRERLEAVGLSAASIAHDLKLPLATAELAISDSVPGSPPPSPGVSVALRALGRAREIAQGLASFARGTESKLELQPLPLGALLDEHLEETRPLLAAGKVATTSERAWEGSVLANRSAVLRVLGNIAKNAVEAMPQGGALAYRCALSGTERVEVALQDSGPGISPERLAKLFRPFETFGKPGGCGLGLALARDLVRAMGGDIKAESQPGKGALFRVSLKVAPGA